MTEFSTDELGYVLIAILVAALLCLCFGCGCFLCLRRWHKDVQGMRARPSKQDRLQTQVGTGTTTSQPNGHAAPPQNVLIGEKTHVFVDPKSEGVKKERKKSLPEFIVTAKRRLSVFKKKDPRPVSWLDYDRQTPPVGYIDRGAGFYTSQYTVMDKSLDPVNVPVITNNLPRDTTNQSPSPRPLPQLPGNNKDEVTSPTPRTSGDSTEPVGIYQLSGEWNWPKTTMSYRNANEINVITSSEQELNVRHAEQHKDDQMFVSSVFV